MLTLNGVPVSDLDGVPVCIEVLRRVAPADHAPASGPSPETRAKGVKAHQERARAAYADLIGPIRERRRGGSTFRAIADALNAEGHRTRRGSPWDGSNIRRVMGLFAD